MTTSTAPTTTSQMTRWVLILFIVAITIAACWFIKDILMLTLTAIVLAVLLTTPIRFFVKRGVSRPIAVFMTLILIILFFMAIVLLVLPALWDQFRELITRYIPGATQRLVDQLNSTDFSAAFPFLKPEELDSFTRQLSTQLLGGVANISGQIFPFANQLLGGLTTTLLSILIVFFLSLYFVADPHMHERGMIALIPLRYRGRAREILQKIDITLRKYLQAQIVLMLVIGVSTTIALMIMGVPLAAALGTITGLFAFVPNFGPLVALVPILAVAIINTPQQVVLVVVVFYILQFVQSQLITPLLMGQEVNLPPAMILLSQIVAGIFFGFLGLLLSVPLAAILVVLVREIYVKDILGDTSVDSGESVAKSRTDPGVVQVAP